MTPRPAISGESMTRELNPSIVEVGFIGTGVMGLPMALNVLRAGYRLAVFDLNDATVEMALAAGAVRAGSIAELARASDVVITMLPDAPDVLSVALGTAGIEENARPGTLYIDMSTIDPMTTRFVGARLAQRRIDMIDSPVARGVDNARAGTLALMVGGGAGLVAAADPLLRTMADTITHCGELGNGVAMKLVNNFLSHGIVSTVTEALALGMKAGLPLEMIIQVSGGTGTNNAWLHRLLPSRALKGDFTPGFASRLARKDQRLALEFAREMGVPLTLGAAVMSILDETARAFPNEDFTSMLKVAGERTGVSIRLSS